MTTPWIVCTVLLIRTLISLDQVRALHVGQDRPHPPELQSVEHAPQAIPVLAALLRLVILDFTVTAMEYASRVKLDLNAQGEWIIYNAVLDRFKVSRNRLSVSSAYLVNSNRYLQAQRVMIVRRAISALKGLPNQ
jgi:hypothetical protein